MQSSPPAIEPVLKVEDVAEILGVCHKTVYRMVQAGQIPAFRVGRALRFRAAEIRELATGA